ncbi:hypothetical protein DH2020_041673 [Rehmannia glutinosa]|uniref:Uncharacterized protein n=1 Tax=Rehmannia glutinosa TaxID=99300 RepID=A0ABR0URG0_REHGL
MSGVSDRGKGLLYPIGKIPRRMVRGESTMLRWKHRSIASRVAHVNLGVRIQRRNPLIHKRAIGVLIQRVVSAALTRREEEERVERKPLPLHEGRDPQPAKGTIDMIVGGPTDGDSNRARKAHARLVEGSVWEVERDPRGPRVCFGVSDLKGVSMSHNDALVVTVNMANFEVARPW